MTPCNCCGAPTDRTTGTCYTCRRHLSSCADEIALPPGRWVPTRGGIVIYRLSLDGGPARRGQEFCGTERGYQWHRHNDPFNWPLPADDPCGCRAAHRAHNQFVSAMRQRAKYHERKRQEVA